MWGLVSQPLLRISKTEYVSLAKWIRDGGAGGQQFRSIGSITNQKCEQKCNNLQDCLCCSVLHDFHYYPFAAVQMEWLISACEGPLKWHARSTLLLHFTTGEAIHVSTRAALQRKQRINKPIIVLTDLSHCYQGLQVLVRLVRVDVVQWAAVPGVSIRGCEVDGNLKWKKNSNINNVRFCLLLQNFFQRLVTWLLHPCERPEICLMAV